VLLAVVLDGQGVEAAGKALEDVVRRRFVHVGKYCTPDYL
jgi:hypothetical protein